MKRYVLFIGLLSFFFCSQLMAQEQQYPNKVATPTQFDIVKNVKINVIPRDTLHLQPGDSGAVAYKGGNFYLWNGYIWKLSSGSGGGSGSDTTRVPKNTTLQIGPDTKDLSSNRSFLDNVVNSLQIINGGGANKLTIGNYASRPIPGGSGDLYIVSDSNFRLSYSNGSSWIWITDKVGIKDSIATSRPIYVIKSLTGGKDSLAVKYDSAVWNAAKLLGLLIDATPPTDGQVLTYDGTSGKLKYKTGTGGTGTTNITVSQVSAGVTVNSSTGSPGNLDTATTTTHGVESKKDKALLSHPISIENVSGVGDTTSYADTTGGIDRLKFKRFVFRGGLAVTTYQDSLVVTIDTINRIATIKRLADSLAVLRGLIGSGSVQADYTQATTTDPSYIKNKPTLGTAAAKNVPASGNAAAGEVVMGNDTRLGGSQNLQGVLTNQGSTPLTSAPTINQGGNAVTWTNGLNKYDSINIGSGIVRSSLLTPLISFLGTSITAGSTGPTSSWYRYSTVATRHLAGQGYIEVNIGAAGSTISTQWGNVPNYTGGPLVVEFGTNEILTGVDTATFRANYLRLWDSITVHGFPASKVYMLSQWGMQLNTVPSTTLSAAIAIQKGFNYVDSTVALLKHATYVDVYYPYQKPEYLYLAAAAVHMDNLQNYFGGSIVAGYIKPQYNDNHQVLMARDTVQFDHLLYKNQKLIVTGKALGVDAQGNIGIIQQFGNNTAFSGNTYVNNNLQFRGAALPSAWDSTKDIIMGPNAKFYQSFSSSIYSLFQPMNSAGTGTYTNNFGTGVFNWTCPTTNFIGNLALGAIGNTFTGNTFQWNQGQNNSLVLSVPGTGMTQYHNKFAGMGYEWYSSDSTAGSDVMMMKLFPKGRFILQEGGTYAESPSVKMAINSTTEGVLIPRMTTTQRNAIPVGRVSAGHIVSAGTGYTTGTYNAVAFTGGSGQGFTTSLNVASGGVIVVTIPPATATGYNYKIGDILSVNASSVGGTGSGFTYQIDNVLENGLMVIANNKPNWYDGALGWRAAADSASATGSGISSLNSLTGPTQTFGVGTSGTDFNINSSGTAHNFNIPSMAGSSVTRGLITNGTQTLPGAKTFTTAPILTGVPSATSGTALMHVADSSVAQMGLSYGTYTPTGAAILNITSWSASSCNYTRVGNMVTVYGTFGATPTATGKSTIHISVPISSSFSSAPVTGSGYFTNSSTAIGPVVCDYNSSNTDILLTFYVGTLASGTGYFSFMYKIE